tara:strand:+ start:6000 stop:6575 length:576 start_codon:yes stop_codon:yes gene_type:complete
MPGDSVTPFKETVYRFFIFRASMQNHNTHIENRMVETAQNRSGTGVVSMKFKALLTAPLSYLAFSTPATGKSDKAATQKSAAPKKSRTAKAPRPAQLKPYRGTSIVVGDDACDAVKAIGTRRFLLADGDTPMLPLAACDASRCTCTYMHHDDRRDDDDDRRLTAALSTDLYEDSGNENRRSAKRGRRKTDR